MFDLTTLIEIVVGNMLEFADSGAMAREGVSFFETPYELTAVYNTNAIKYIIYQEEGFIHWRSGKFIDKNKGFISVKAEGKIARALNNDILGIPNDFKDNTNVILDNNLKMVQDIGGVVNV